MKIRFSISDKNKREIESKENKKLEWCLKGVIKSYLATQLCSPEAEISCGHSGI
jgi:hypothetical protein